MRYFVDTSVWINYFRGNETEKTKALAHLIESGQPIYSLPVVVQEIMQGFRSDKDIPKEIVNLEALNFLSFDYQDAVEAARLYRLLRKSGITPTTIDLQIAAVCIKHKLHLLTEDSDFSAMGKKIQLSVVPSSE